MDEIKLSLHKFLGLFREIPESDFTVIAGHLEIRRVMAGEVLLAEEEIAKELFFVVQGILKITSTSEKGNDVILFFVKENKFCTILRSFTGAVAANESIVAATDATLLVFSRQNLDRTCEKLPYFKSLIEGITHQALLDKIQLRNSYMGEEASTRYLRFITQQPDIMLRISLGDVASYLGITQQSLSRIRKNISFK